MAVISRGQITLTDLTDQRPARMDLKTSLSIIQKEFNGKFEPNYIASGTSIGEVPESGQIITPTVYFGNEEVSYEKYYFSIIYNCSDTGDNVDYKYDPDNEIPQDGSTFVDRYGRLHFNRNLTQTTVIEVEIPELIDEATGVLYSSISEEISLSKVDYKSGYGAYIESKDGRYDFKKEGASPIELEAKLFYGTEQISAKSYQWYTSIDDENAIFTGQTYVVVRDNVHGHETFICKMTTEEDMVFQAQIGIEDRLDDFYSEIIVSKGILTPIENTAQLSIQVFEKGQVYSHPEDIKIIYDWYYSIGEDFNNFTNDNFNIINIKLDQSSLVGNNPIVDENGVFHFLKKDLTFYCKTSIYRIPTASNKIEEETLIGAANTYVPIRYSPNTIVSLNPENIFISTKEDGSFSGETFSQTIIFKITDDAGVPIDYENVGNNLDSSGIGITGLTGTEEKTKNPFSFSVDDIGNGDKWIKEITITLVDTEKFKKLENTTSFTINYTRLGYDFSKDFYIIKNTQGVSGYGFTLTLDNDYHKFAGGETAARANQKTEFTFEAFLAEDKLRINTVTIGNTILSPGEENWNIIEGLGITLTTAEDNFSATIKLKTGNGEDGKPFLTEGGKISIIATVIRENGESFDFIKSFQYDINFNGDSYSLKCEPASVVYSPATSSFDVEQIILKAERREGGVGPNIEYKQGYVYYFIDDSKVGNQLTSTSGTYIFNLTSANGITEKTKRVMFKLYSSQYDPDNPDEGYMMDQETISFITSSDGITIGGTNLLRWTKELPVESGKWSREGSGSSSKISITTDTDEFSILTFNVDGTGDSNTWYGFHSPKIAFSEDFLNKTFCFSCLYKKEDISEISGLVSVQCHTSLAASRKGWKDFGLKKKYFMEEKDNTWVKLFFNFEIKEDFFKTSSGTTVDINTITHLSIGFWARGNSKKFSIKKPKLELGTQSTDWSANPYDIDFSDIGGTNLAKVNNSYTFILKAEDKRVLIGDNLLKNTPYTISWQNSSASSGSDIDEFYWEVCSTQNSSTILESGTFKIGINSFEYCFNPKNEESVLFFYSKKNNNTDFSANTYITLEKLKLEKGTTSTSFMMTPEQINAMAQSLAEISSNNLANDIYKLPIIEGSQSDTISFTTADEWIAFITETNENNGEIKQYGSVQEQVNKSYNILDGRLHAYEGRIMISAADPQNPYISISAVEANENSSFQNYLKLTPTAIQFYSNGNIVAELQQEILTIENVKMNNSFSLGELLVKITEDNNVGFLWS